MPTVRKIEQPVKRKRGRPKGSTKKAEVVEEGYRFRCKCGKTARSPHKQSIMLCKHGADDYREMELVP